MVRILTALVLVPVVVGAIWFFTPWQLLLFAGVFLVLAFREYAALASRLDTPVATVAAGTATSAACVAIAMPAVPLDVTLMAATIAMAALALAGGPPSPAVLPRLAVGLFPALYIGLPIGMLVAIHALAGREVLLLLILTVATSDTAQFYVGSLAGRTKLAEAISPKKTVEGAIGGLLAGPLFVLVVGTWWLPGVPPLGRAGLGAVVAALGMLGDLFESMLKRSAGVKDTSGLFPGHGGVLDRIDALLFAAPAFYVLVRAGL